VTVGYLLKEKPTFFVFLFYTPSNPSAGLLATSDSWATLLGRETQICNCFVFKTPIHPS
jgi:hypothetical protein